MKIFHKRYHPPGTAPGTYVTNIADADSGTNRPVKIEVVKYSPTELVTYTDIDVNECLRCIDNQSVTWINVSGYVDSALLGKFGESFGIHPLALEDVFNKGQRPKVESYPDQLFVIANLPVINNDEIHIEQVSLFCGPGYVLSFHDQYDPNSYKLLHSRLQKNTNYFRNSGSDYLLYVLLDLIIDNGFPVLEIFADKLEAIEVNLLAGKAKGCLNDIHHIKRDLILLRRALWPQRELLNNLIRDEYGAITDATTLYLRDCYDHTIQILEMIESYREMASSTHEVYLSTVSFRLNEVMRFLTVISTLFIPPTFIVGVYGMNFRESASPWNMPELSWYFGYPLVWGVIVIMVGLMLAYFKRKHWF